MLLGFKTELKLNNRQKTMLAQHAGVARHAWNWGHRLCIEILENNQNNPEDKIKFPTAMSNFVQLLYSGCIFSYLDKNERRIAQT